MKSLFGLLRAPLLHVAGFSFVVNPLLLVPAIFMPQVFDRVLSSGSTETLIGLPLGVAIALDAAVRTRLPAQPFAGRGWQRD
jgi:ABC-type protease/lipase transport system fused ATPase/permease subunit